jgi:hypothetical protein
MWQLHRLECSVVLVGCMKDTTKFINKSLRTSIVDAIHCKYEVLSSRHGCRYEDWLRQKDKCAILGVNSNWVGDNILAMSRPSDEVIEQQQIIIQVGKDLCIS